MSRHLRPSLVLLTGLLLLVLALGCRTRGPGDSGFLADPSRMQPSPELPFAQSWFDPTTDWSAFRSVHVAPVDTAHLRALGWWEKASTTGQPSPEQLAELAAFARTSVEEAFRERGRLVPVIPPVDDTLVIELAIVDVVPTKVWLNTLLGAWSKGWIGIEARWRSGPDGPIVAVLADGMSGRPNLASREDFTWWGHARSALTTWGGHFARAAESGGAGPVPGRPPAALVTW